VPARSNGRAAFIPPELATLVADPPLGEGWLHEIKFDGYRIETLLDRGKARCLTRAGLDWTERFPAIAQAVSRIPARNCTLDGEVVALLPDGRSSFQALQERLHADPPGDLVYYVFDLLRLDGVDLREEPLDQRKEMLRKLFRGLGRGGRRVVRYSDHVAGRARAVLARACRLGLEGVVSKRRDAPYRSGRNRNWLKIKCVNRQELMIVGFTEPQGRRTGVGALLLGVYDSRGTLQYAGKVGTGMSETLLGSLRAELDAIERKRPTVDAGAEGRRGGVHWVEPRLVAEVAFTEWTRDGRLRHPAFVALREDKSPREVRREVAK
jgi:bifunctional non-homologous end joining protein LigD